MIDKAVVIDGLGAIRRFFEIGQPSQAIIFDSYQNIIDGAIELIHNQQSQIVMLDKLLKEQPNIVRCKDCKWYDEQNSKKTRC